MLSSSTSSSEGDTSGAAAMVLRELRAHVPRIAAFLALLVVLDRGLGAAFDWAFRRLEVGVTGAMVNGLRAARADVVVLGSSRAHCHYDPAILGPALGASVVNAGWPGQHIPYMRGVADLLLLDYTPRLFVLQVDPELVLDMGVYGRVSTLAPFVAESTVVRNLIYARSDLEWLKYSFVSFRFNDRPLRMLRDLIFGDENVAAFGPLHRAPGARVLEEQMFPRSAAPLVRRYAQGPDPLLVSLLRDLIRAAKARGVGVVLVTAPRWRPAHTALPARERLLHFLEQLAGDEDVPFLQLTFEKTPELRDPDLYADTFHLNARGAAIFSELVAERLVALNVLSLPSAERKRRPVDREPLALATP